MIFMKKTMLIVYCPSSWHTSTI